MLNDHKQPEKSYGNLILCIG